MIQSNELEQYSLDQSLYYGSQTVIWRGRKIGSESTVILKLVAEPSHENVTRLKHEFKLLNSLKNIDGIIHPLGEVTLKDNQYGLVLEDTHQKMLASFIEDKPMSIERFLTIAIALTKIIKDLHDAGIIHKDIKPANILIDDQNNVTLVDFSIAAEISRERQALVPPENLEGTLAFMSPEQTGRMNQFIDHRTDMYSLGVTFYQMLIGRVPFYATDSLDMIHAHMTEIAKSPHEINSVIPKVLSDIVMVLLAKQPSERYQSAYTLEKDLQHALKEWNQHHSIPVFPIRENDIPAQLTFPEKIYGRDQQLQQLEEYFTNTKKGKNEIVMVTGDPGVGKTELVNQVRYQVVKQKCFFIRGKFDQYRRDHALDAIAQAINDFTLQLMSLPETNFNEWRIKIKNALGPNGKLLTDLVPNLINIIGEQPPLEDLDPNQSFNRLIYTLQSFLSVIATGEHPLIIFLDDLQWSDNVTLRWLHELAAPSINKLTHLFLIGAYRQNEKDLYDLNNTISGMQKYQDIHFIHLSNLSEDIMTTWLSDALYTNKDAVEPFAKVFYQKTEGNPFNMTTMLNTLYLENIVNFNHKEGKWSWDLVRVKSKDKQDNVINLTYHFLQHLPEDCQKVLEIAACIGHEFSLSQLSYIMGKSQAETAIALKPAISKSIIFPLSADYRLAEFQSDENDFGISYQFAHDRLQQIAYNIVDEEHRAKTHYQIGKLLWEQNNEALRRDKIIDITNHYNFGLKYVQTSEEKNRVIELNCQASMRAKSSANFIEAARYANQGLELMPINPWKTQYQTMFTLMKLQAESAYALGDYAKAQQSIQQLLDHTRSTIDRMQIYYLNTQLNTVQGKLQDAISTMIEGMKLGGFYIPRHPSAINVVHAFYRYWRVFREVQIEDLLDRPPASSPTVLWVIKLFQIGGTALYETDSANLIVMIILNSLIYIEEKGVTSYSAFPCAASAYLFGGILGKYELAERWTNFAKKINERYNDPLIRATFLQCYLHFNYWRQKDFTIKEHIELARTGLLYAQQAGDKFIMTDMLTMASPRRASLQEQVHYINSTIPVVKSMNVPSMFERYLRFFALVYNEAGESVGPNSISYSEFDSVYCINKWEREKNYLQLSCCNIMFSTIAFRNENYQAFYDHFTKTSGYFSFAERVEDTYIFAPISYLFLNPIKKLRLLLRILKDYKVIKGLAEYNEENFAFYRYFMQGSFARMLGLKKRTQRYYDLALQSMEKNVEMDKIPMDKYALMLEAVGVYYLGLQQQDKGQQFLNLAYQIFKRYGFITRIKILEQRYPFLTKINMLHTDTAETLIRESDDQQ